MNRVRLAAALDALEACGRGKSFAGPRAESAARPDAEWTLSVRPGAPLVRLTTPGFDRVWDPEAGAWSDAPRAGAPRPFSARAFPEPARGRLAEFHALHPLSESRATASGWRLSPRRPVPWPALLRCDLSAAFAPEAALLSLILRDARVAALEFDGEALWAACRG